MRNQQLNTYKKVNVGIKWANDTDKYHVQQKWCAYVRPKTSRGKQIQFQQKKKQNHTL